MQKFVKKFLTKILFRDKLFLIAELMSKKRMKKRKLHMINAVKSEKCHSAKKNDKKCKKAVDKW